MIVRRFALAACLVIAPPLAAQSGTPLSARIDRIINRPEFKHAIWGIEFYDLESKRPIYTLNEEKLFTPGSTTKLLSTGTALATLGADHRFHTRVYRTGPVTNGTLQGDLVLVASGDPNLSQRLRPDGTLAFENHDHTYGGAPDTKAVPGDPLQTIQAIAAQVAAKGIKRIAGRVLVDVSLYKEGERELGTGIVISPISVNDNVLDVTVTPGAAVGMPARLTVSPRTAHVKIVNQLTTADSGKGGEPNMADPVTNADGSVTVVVTGKISLGTPSILYALPVPVPSRFAETVLREALVAKGVQLTGILTAPATPAADFAQLKRNYRPENVVAEHVSAPATEMIKVILKVSQNMHASSIPFLLGALKGDSTKNGFDVEREFLTGAGLDISGAQQGDGAGGDAHFSPAFMVSYLEMMSKRSDYRAFHSALPVLGKDGTLYNIQSQSPAAGFVHAKTGTFAIYDPLNRALLVTGKGMAGYMTTASGKQLAFAIYANNVKVSLAPDETTKVVGEALGEVAVAGWDDR